MPAGVNLLLQRIEYEVGAQRRGDTPADDAAREDVDHEGDVDEAGPRGDVRQVADPELIRSRRDEVAIDPRGLRGNTCGVGPWVHSLNEWASYNPGTLHLEGNRSPAALRIAAVEPADASRSSAIFTLVDLDSIGDARGGAVLRAG
jgi:hypothetical protein